MAEKSNGAVENQPAEIKENQPKSNGRGGVRVGAGRPRRGALVVDTAGRMELMQEVVALRDEVARLKRELAARPDPPGATPNIARSANAASVREERECVHGGLYGRCRNIGCRPK